MATRAEPIVTLDTVDSTQRVAFELAADGAPDGAVVVANHQHAGRGRRGRVWQAAPGTSLLASIVLRPRLAPPEAPRLSFAAAIAVAEAIERLTGVTPKLKWPNDVLLRGRKVAGIQLEARAEASIVVLGIGVNLGQTSFPDDVRDRAISVLQATGIALDRDRLLTVIRERLDVWRARLTTEGFAPLRERWLELSSTIGRVVQIDGVTGPAVDLDVSGALIVADGSGRRAILSGEITEPDAPGR